MFELTDQQERRMQVDDELKIKEYFKKNDFKVIKLDENNNVATADYRIEKGNDRLVIEIKSLFGNKLHDKITDKISEHLSTIGLGFNYCIRHKLTNLRNIDFDKLICEVQKSLKAFSKNPTRELPFCLYMIDEQIENKIADDAILSDDERYISNNDIYYDHGQNSKLIIEITETNRINKLTCDTNIPNIKKPDLNLFKDRINSAQRQLGTCKEIIPKGLIFVGHGIIGGYTYEIMPFGSSDDILPLNETSMRIRFNSYGALRENLNVWLSFYGFFDSELEPRLVIYRNPYAEIKLDIKTLQFNDSKIRSIVPARFGKYILIEH